MKNLIMRSGAKAAVIGASVVALLDAALAHADYSTTTAASDINSMIGSTGDTIGATTTKILILFAALTGLGWGVRKFTRHVSGKKF